MFEKVPSLGGKHISKVLSAESCQLSCSFCIYNLIIFLFSLHHAFSHKTVIKTDTV